MLAWLDLKTRVYLVLPVFATCQEGAGLHECCEVCAAFQLCNLGCFGGSCKLQVCLMKCLRLFFVWLYLARQTQQ